MTQMIMLLKEGCIICWTKPLRGKQAVDVIN